MEIQSIQKENCISLIKLIAAFQVMIGHICAHLELPFPKIARIVWGYYTGVPVFFIISGFLIWFSMERSLSYRNYIKKRFWRIYPELWVAVAVEILSIVVFYSGWNIRDLALFSLTQGTIFQFWTPDSLRGYGCGTPNGTLWTMCVMVQFYVIAWLIRKLFHKKSVLFWLIGQIVLIGASILGQILVEKVGAVIITKLYGQTIIRYAWLFYFGCFIAEFKDDSIPFLSRRWYLFFFAGLVPYLFGYDISAGYKVIWSFLLGCGLVGFAYAFPQIKLKTDISYGIFLYHMIIVNVFIRLGCMKKWAYGIAVLLVTVTLAYISTKTVAAWSARQKALRSQ